MKRINPHATIVKYTYGTYQGRPQTHLLFEEEYPDALRAALDLVRKGRKQVEVIQYREVLHTHKELQEAVLLLHPFSTNEDIVEQVHFASYKPEEITLPQTFEPLVWCQL